MVNLEGRETLLGFKVSNDLKEKVKIQCAKDRKHIREIGIALFEGYVEGRFVIDQDTLSKESN